LKPYSLSWKITKESSGVLVREYLKNNGISKAALTDIKFSGGSITVNDESVTVRYLLQENDILHITFPPEQPSVDMKAENIPLSIVYEDETLLVINKPARMSTIPSREHPSGSLANALLYYYQQNSISSTTHIINRLDRDTSGLLLVAKHRYVHHLLSMQQKKGDIKRRYEALVHGQVQLDQSTINEPIGRKDNSIIEREVRRDGQAAITHFHVLHRYSNFTHVSVKLETGRTHQIRVHMAHIGHPLLGDDLYGGLRKEMARQALHSCELSFIHPISGKQLVFKVPLAKDMEEMILKT
jgi:23S rRNA pseudouridine1911/1915/1917 synthase